MTNILRIHFENNRKVVTSPIHQWDYGQVIVFSDLVLPLGTEIDFSFEDSTESTTGYTVTNDVTIPNELLRRSGRLHVYVYVRTERSGRTLHEAVIPVLARPEPQGR